MLLAADMHASKSSRSGNAKMAPGSHPDSEVKVKPKGVIAEAVNGNRIKFKCH